MTDKKRAKREARRKLKAITSLLTGTEKKALRKARKKGKRTTARPGIKQWCLEQKDGLTNQAVLKERGLL